MGENLSKEKLDKIANNSSVFYFPIRHHSPVCSVQVTKCIQEFKPDCILVEGPVNCKDILKYFLDTKATYPLAIYYSFKDIKGKIGEKNETYNCYYPMLEYSPELVCIREGAKHDIPVEFIDLSYAGRLLNTKEDEGLRKKGEKVSINEDYLVSQNEFITQLYTQYNCRNFDEFWEKIFEIEGLNLSTTEFVDRFNSYTFLLREMSKKSEQNLDGTFIREGFMAKKIKIAMQKYEKILVVTGGFHTYGLIENSTKTYKDLDENKFAKNEIIDGEEAYIMPFSMEETDAINGYASGMVSPAFYQKVWHMMQKSKNNAYSKTVFGIILEVAKESKNKNYQITLPDVKSAYEMAINLAYLRDKTQVGKYECRDGILSAFIKGECNQSNNLPIDILDKIFTGNSMGSITSEFKTPPIVVDFNEKCGIYNLKIADSFEKTTTLSVFTNPKHREVSKFLSQLEFIDCSFAKKISGGRFKNNSNKKLINEKWKYKYSSTVIAKLIENSVYGGNIFDAAYNILLKEIEKADDCLVCSELLRQCFLMGIDDKAKVLFDKIHANIISDKDFFNQANALKNLTEIFDINNFYDDKIDIDIETLIDICFENCINSLEFVLDIEENSENKVIDLIKLLYQLSIQEQFKKHYDNYIETLLNLIEKKDINPTVEGGILGILYITKKVEIDSIFISFDAYLYYTNEIAKAGRFLNGIFTCSREIIFVDSKFIEKINELISTLTFEEFLLILPDLKLSFTHFTPNQIDKISKTIADYNNVSLVDFIKKDIVSEADKIYGNELNEYLKNELKEMYFFE